MCRRGEASASAFLSEFRDLCGHSTEADGVLEAVKQLLPTADLQAALEHATISTKRPAQPEAAAPRQDGKLRSTSSTHEPTASVSAAPAACDARQQQVVPGPEATVPETGAEDGDGVAIGSSDREPHFANSNEDNAAQRCSPAKHVMVYFNSLI